MSWIRKGSRWLLSRTWMLAGCRSPWAITLIVRGTSWWRVLTLNVIDAAVPVCDLSRWSRCLRWRSASRCRSSPLRRRWSANPRTLIRLWMDILRYRSRCVVLSLTLRLSLEKSQTCFDMDVSRVQVSRTPVRIKCVRRLVVARLVLESGPSAKLSRSLRPLYHSVRRFKEENTYQSTQIVPHFRNVRVQANSTRVSIQSITVLIDLIIQNTNGAPESGITTITVDSLLVSLVCLGVFLLRHVTSTQEIPALGVVVIYREISTYNGLYDRSRNSIRHTCANRLLQILNRFLLACVTVALLVVQPTELL